MANIEKHSSSETSIMVTQILELSANASAVDLSSELLGGYLYNVEIVASADDAVVFKINSGLGTEIFPSWTTTAATSGEDKQPPWYKPITRIPNYTLSDLDSGTVTIEVTVVKR